MTRAEHAWRRAASAAREAVAVRDPLAIAAASRELTAAQARIDRQKAAAR